MALTGPDGEQHSHLSPRDRMLARYDADRARAAKEPPPLPAMRPDRGHWVGPGSAKAATPPDSPSPAVADPVPVVSENARHAGIDAISALGEILRDQALTRVQKDTIVNAIAVVAALL